MVNVEYNLMGIILNYPEYIKQVDTNIFQNEICRKLYDVIKKENKFNRETIIENIKNSSDINEYDINVIYNTFYRVEDFDIYHDHVRTNWVKKRLIEKVIDISNKKIKKIDDMRNEMQDLLIILDSNKDEENISSKKIVQGIMERNYNIKTVKSNIPYIDYYGGYEITDLIIIAARTSIGKTSLILNLILDQILEKRKIGIFSLEVGNDKICSNIAFIQSGLSEWKMKRGLLSKEQTMKYYESFQYLYSESLMMGNVNDISKIELKIKKMIKENKIEMIYIDHLGYIKGGEGKSRYDQVSNIVIRLKRLAYEYEIPVICLAQLNRECIKNERKPRLSDLRESGEIEQSADIIMLLSEKSSITSTMEITLNCEIAKNRNNPTGEFPILFDKKIRKMIFKNDGV